LITLCPVSGGLAQAPADLVVYGRVWTGDSARPWAEAVAVRGDRIAAVGSRTDVARLAGAGTRVLDNGRALVTPGLGDSHTHFVEGGFQLVSVDLRDADTPEEFIRRIARFARGRRPGEWILGGDWDHERWAGSPLPRREWIDSVTSANPVFVQRLDGHMGLANSLALRAARTTPWAGCSPPSLHRPLNRRTARWRARCGTRRRWASPPCT
jgi:predicted amidohydrolase YtcJ